MAKGNTKKPANGSALEFETQLRAATDKPLSGDLRVSVANKIAEAGA